MRDWAVVTTEEELREVVGEPAPAIAAKGRGGVDAVSREFIEAARLFFVATSGADGGMDLSPRGDVERSVLVLGERTLAFADRRGNRRVDTLRNLLRRPDIGLLFVVPGRTEVLRVNGRATIVRSAPFFAELGDPPLAVVVDVTELFVHCGRAFLRSGAWQPETWPDASDLPSAAELFKSQLDAAGYFTAASPTE